MTQFITLQQLMTHPQAVNSIEIFIYPESEYLSEGYKPPVGCVYADLAFTTQVGECKAAFHKVANVEYDFQHEKILDFALLNEDTDYILIDNIKGYHDVMPLDMNEAEPLLASDLTLKQWIVGCNIHAGNYNLANFREMPRRILGSYDCFLAS